MYTGLISGLLRIARSGLPIQIFNFEEEIEALDNKIGDADFHLAYEVYLYHGLRRAQLTKLMVQDVDKTASELNF